MRFEWNHKKAELNLRRHGVSFEEAKTVFEDSFFLIFRDDRCVTEQRFIITGESIQRRLLVVAYCERGNRTRIISARLATRRERSIYEEV